MLYDTRSGFLQVYLWDLGSGCKVLGEGRGSMGVPVWGLRRDI